MIFIVLFITLGYVLLISSFIIGFDRIKEFKESNADSPQAFSIIIPFRNEEQNLPILIKSLQLLDYPKSSFEVIFVNDGSEDDSVNIIKKTLDAKTSVADSFELNVAIIDNIRKTNSPKKDAINTAMLNAKFDWVITTDADCRVPKKWLQSFNAFISKSSPKFIVAPVTYFSSTSFLDKFQLLDMLSLQGATIGGFGIKRPFLCNGANLCYSKEIFKQVNGFEGNSSIASGDDVFLLEKILEKSPDKVSYLKSRNVIVYSNAQSSFNKLIHQRMRWAAKTTGYKNSFSKLVALSVFTQNTLLIVLLLLSILGKFSSLTFLIIVLIKLFIDALLIFKTATFFNQKNKIVHYVLSSIIYPFFSMFVAIASLTSGYQWKGRHFQR